LGRSDAERVLDVVSMVSHELRGPLTAISASLGLLQSGALGELPDGTAAMVRTAYRNSGRLERIVNDILDIGTLEAGKLAVRVTGVPLAQPLEESLEAGAGHAALCQVRYVLERAHADERVMADPHRLVQVMTNLLSNAAKFSPPGADVHIRVRPGAHAVRIEVEDFGPGIPAAFQSRIFEKFARADSSVNRRFGGAGLGLSIARQLIDAMGGVIGFDSVIGRGTVFNVELRRAAA
jgi:signal transduction histidine kinase